MGVGAPLSSTCTMSLLKKFTFAVSSPGEFLVFVHALVLKREPLEITGTGFFTTEWPSCHQTKGKS